MNRNLSLVLVCFVFLTSCGNSLKNYDPYKKFSPQELQEDFRIAWITYQQKHPGKYWYNPKDTVDYYFQAAYNSLGDSMTEKEFRNRLAFAIEKIKCGHSSVRISKKSSAYFEKHQNEIMFPLAMKVWGGDSMVVIGNAFRKDSDLVRGTVIKSINGKTVAEMLAAIGQFISTDGWNNNFKYQVISNSFPTQYKNTYGLSDYYDITFQKPDGSVATNRIANFNPKADTLDKKRIDSMHFFMPKKKERPKRLSLLRNLSIDTTNNLALMKLNTFSDAKLPSFFRRSFRTMAKKHIQNLTIELRENGGGSLNSSTLLTRFIIDHPFRNADTVAGIGKSFPYPEFVQKHFLYSLFRTFFTHKKSDGRYHIRTIERHVFNPKQHNHFNGHVYIITGGFTFSASTLFIRPLLGQKNVTVVGEETGGGAYGNNAVNIPDITLPNTHLRVRLPLYRMVLDSTATHNGRGILPDVFVPPSSQFIRQGKDPKMAKVLELINRK